MKILAQIPLLLLVLITYCAIALVSPDSLGIEINNTDAIEQNTDDSIPTESVFQAKAVKPVFVMQLVSGATWGLDFGQVLIVVAILLLFVEIFKSTRTSASSIVDHMLSTLVLIIFLVLFLTWDRAGTGVFFILSIITLVDVLCGFTVSISSARRDVSFASE